MVNIGVVPDVPEFRSPELRHDAHDGNYAHKALSCPVIDHVEEGITGCLTRDQPVMHGGLITKRSIREIPPDAQMEWGAVAGRIQLRCVRVSR